MSPGKSGGAAQLSEMEAIQRFLAEFSNYHRHGELYTNDNSLSITVTTAGTFVVSTGWTAGKSTGASHVVLDAANGTITIGEKGQGNYYAWCESSFESDKANVIIHAALFINGSIANNIAWRRDIGTANEIGNAKSEGFFLSNLVKDDVVDYRFTSDANNTVIPVDHGSFGILWVAGE